MRAWQVFGGPSSNGKSANCAEDGATSFVIPRAPHVPRPLRGPADRVGIRQQPAGGTGKQCRNKGVVKPRWNRWCSRKRGRPSTRRGGRTMAGSRRNAKKRWAERSVKRKRPTTSMTKSIVTEFLPDPAQKSLLPNSITSLLLSQFWTEKVFCRNTTVFLCYEQGPLVTYKLCMEKCRCLIE